MEFVEILKSATNQRQGYDPRKIKKNSVIDEIESLRLHFGADITEKEVRKFLKVKSPNQSIEEFEYEVNNFNLTTKRIIKKLAGLFQKVVNSANYSINNFTYEYPLYGSLHNYYSTIYVRNSLIDSNAIRVTMPNDIPLTPEGNYDDSKQVEVIDKIIPYTDILINKPSTISFITRKDIKLNGGGLGFEVDVLDLNSYRKFRQINKYSDWEFEEVFVINHNAEHPLWNTVGSEPWLFADNEIIYTSPLSSVLPDLNAYLKNSSNLFVSTQGRLFAERIELGDNACTTCYGATTITDDNGNHSTCSTCSGTGVQPRSGKLTTKMVNIANMDDEKAKYMIDSIRYVTPPQAPLEFVNKLLSETETKIYESMNMQLTASNETATGRRIDRDEHFTMLQSFQDALFNSMVNSIYGILVYQGKKDQEFNIVKPLSHDRLTASEIILEVEKNKSVNQTLYLSSLTNYVTSRYGEESEINELITLQKMADRLMGLSITEQAAMLGVGAADVWELYLSQSFTSIYETLKEELREIDDLNKKAELIKNYARERSREISRGSTGII